MYNIKLTEWDNLPDYRMPHDQGFAGYNTSWLTPDFSAVCAKRLEEKASAEKSK